MSLHASTTTTTTAALETRQRNLDLLREKQRREEATLARLREERQRQKQETRQEKERQEKQRRSLDERDDASASTKVKTERKRQSSTSGHAALPFQLAKDDDTVVRRFPSTMSTAARDKVRAKLLKQAMQPLNLEKRDVRNIDQILIDRARAKQEGRQSDKASSSSQGILRPEGKPLKSQLEVPSQKIKRDTVVKAEESRVRSESKGPIQSRMTPALAVDAQHRQRPAPLTEVRPGPTPAKKKPQIEARPREMPLSSSLPKGKPHLPSGGKEHDPSSRQRAKARPPAANSRSEPTPGRRSASPEFDYRTEIWKLFGKDRAQYQARPAYSDDEDDDDDMESAGFEAVEREEVRSSKLARKEDLAEEARLAARAREKAKRKALQSSGASAAATAPKRPRN